MAVLVDCCSKNVKTLSVIECRQEKIPDTYVINVLEYLYG